MRSPDLKSQCRPGGSCPECNCHERPDPDERLVDAREQWVEQRRDNENERHRENE